MNNEIESYKDCCLENMFSNALILALNKHKGQVDKAGQPYIYHLLRVMSYVPTNKEKTVAILHDILEDTDTTVEQLKEIGIIDDIIDAVVLLTKNDKEDYVDYIKRIKNNDLARAVKLSDLKDDMDLSRLDNITEEDYKRYQKYLKAYKILKE